MNISINQFWNYPHPAIQNCGHCLGTKSKLLSNKYEQRGYIKKDSYPTRRKPPQIHEKLVKVFHVDAISYPTVKEGRHDIEDQPRSGRPISSSTPEITAQIQELVDIVPNLTIEEIAIIFDISTGSVNSILHDTLDFRNISSR